MVANITCGFGGVTFAFDYCSCARSVETVVLRLVFANCDAADLTYDVCEYKRNLRIRCLRIRFANVCVANCMFELTCYICHLRM